MGYLGFVPGISHLFGSDRPVTLGVIYSHADYDSFVRLAQTKIIISGDKGLPRSNLKFSGQIKLNQAFSQGEVSARINYSLWKYMPISDFQIRFLENDYLEFSGNLKTDRLDGFIKSFTTPDFTGNPINNCLKILELIPNSIPIYIKAAVSYRDNVVLIKTAKVVIGKVNFPLDQIDFDAFINEVTEKIVDKIPGFYVDSVNFSGGRMNFVGLVPAEETIAGI
jgi:hypothetical protein